MGSREDARWAREEETRRLMDLAGQLGLDGSELASDVVRRSEKPSSKVAKKKGAGVRGFSTQLVFIDEVADWNTR